MSSARYHRKCRIMCSSGIWMYIILMFAFMGFYYVASDCQNPTMINSGTERKPDFRITWYCRLDDVHRDGIDEKGCNFFWRDKTKIPEKWNPVNNNYMETIQTIAVCYKGVNYCMKICNLSLPVLQLKPVSIGFQLRLGDDDKAVHKFTSSSTINLAVPQVELVDCPTGYIKDHTEASCTCNLVDKGSPPSNRVLWIDSKNGVKDSHEDTAILKMFYQPGTDDLLTYDCVAKGGFEQRKNYKPKFAYGPKQINFIPRTSKPAKLCKGRAKDSSVPISLTCDILRSSYNPGIVVSVEGFDNDTHVASSGVTYIQNGYQRFSFVAIIKRGGNYTLICVARNEIFNEIKVKKSTSFEVQEPPEEPPILSIDDGTTLTNGQIIVVAVNQKVTIRCLVPGGYPLVNQITLNVLGKGITTMTGHQVSVNVTITDDILGRDIECSAKHVTECYSKTTRITLKKPSHPHINSFSTVSPEHSELKVGVNLTFTCRGEGVPLPDVTIRDPSDDRIPPDKVIESGASKTIHASILTASCHDSGKYTCIASNSVGIYRKDHLMLVRSPMEITYPDPNASSLYDVREGGNLTIEMDVCGYPGPELDGATLSKMTKAGKEVLWNQEWPENSGDRIEVAVHHVHEARRLMSLIFYKVGLKDAGQHQLSLGNGLTPDLDYTFQIHLSDGPEDRYDTVKIVAIVLGILLGLAMAANIVWIVKKLRRRGFSNQPATTSDNVPRNERDLPPVPLSPHVGVDENADGRPGRIWEDKAESPYEEADVVQDNNTTGYSNQRTKNSDDFATNNPGDPFVPLPPDVCVDEASGDSTYIEMIDCPSANLYEKPDGILVGFQVDKAESPYVEGDAKEGANTSEYANQGGSLAKPENVYDSMESNPYVEPGIPYARFQPGQMPPDENGTDYENTPTP